MPGARGTERRRLSGQVLVRLPPVTHAAVTARAAAAGLTGGAWIRGQLVDLLGADPADAVPVAARRAPRPPVPTHVIEVARLREATAEMTGTLVQALIRSRESDQLVIHDAIEAVLPDVRRVVRELDALKRAMLAESPPSP